MKEWIKALRAECRRTSQIRVARRLGVSATSINQVLGGNYKASTARIEQRVRGELMRETVECPVLGEITKRRCDDEQRRPFASTNPQRIAVYKACRSGCSHSGLKASHD